LAPQMCEHLLPRIPREAGVCTVGRCLSCIVASAQPTWQRQHRRVPCSAWIPPSRSWRLKTAKSCSRDVGASRVASQVATVRRRHERDCSNSTPRFDV
jgi:hypothetical protein